MKNKFIKHLKEIVDYKNCSFLLAVSGGVDSMVLFSLFKEFSLNFWLLTVIFYLEVSLLMMMNYLLRKFVKDLIMKFI